MMTLWQLIICGSLAVARAGLISCPTFHKASPVIPRLKFIAPLRTFVSDSKEGEGGKDDNDPSKKGEECQDYNAKKDVKEVVPIPPPPPNKEERDWYKFERSIFTEEPVKERDWYKFVGSIFKERDWYKFVGSILAGGGLIVGLYTYRVQVQQQRVQVQQHQVQVQQHLENSVEFQVKRAIPEIMKSKVSLKKRYVARPSLDEDLKTFLFTPEEENIFTKVIIGCRGFGKTTSVMNAFDKVEGVHHVVGTYVDFNGAIESLLSHLNVKAGKSVRIVEDILSQLPSEGLKPTFIFDIDERWSSAEVEKLILFAKRWGPDQSVAQFVLVFSGSVATYHSIDFPILRCRLMEINEAQKPVIIDFFEQRMKGFTGVEKGVSEHFASKVGGSFLVAANLIGLIKSKKPPSIKDFIDHHMRREESLWIVGIHILLESLKLSGYRRADIDHAKIALLEELVEGNEVSVYQFIETFNMTLEDTMDLCQIRPHVLYYNYEKRTLQIKYSIMRKVFKEFLL